MFAFPSPTKTGAGTCPRSSVVGHGVGIALAPNNVIRANLGQRCGLLALGYYHVLTNAVKRQSFRHFHPMLTGDSPLLTSAVSVELVAMSLR